MDAAGISKGSMGQPGFREDQRKPLSVNKHSVGTSADAARKSAYATWQDDRFWNGYFQTTPYRLGSGKLRRALPGRGQGLIFTRWQLPANPPNADADPQ